LDRTFKHKQHHKNFCLLLSFIYSQNTPLYYVRLIISDNTRAFSSKVFFDEREKQWEEEIFLLFFLILIREESQSMLCESDGEQQ
tara:strand:- start:1600 stop:1854 length:255 start_codon:yes stop_codon:yes gene_type:complete